MRRRRIVKLICIGCVILALLVLAFFLLTPDVSTTSSSRHTGDSVAVTVYLTKETIQPLLQKSLDRQVPTLSASAIKQMMKNLPPVYQGWGSMLAGALIKPTARVMQLVSQRDGIHATIGINLYPGAPQSIEVPLLVNFSLLDAHTIQVSARSSGGGFAPLNGPVQTIRVPLGRLTSVKPTPSCGSCMLALGLQLPVDLTSTQDLPSFQAGTALPGLSEVRMPDNTVPAFVEIPASSLLQLAQSMGPFTLNNSLTAQNIRFDVQDSNMTVVADIVGSFMGGHIKLGTATTRLRPAAQDGKLTFHVQKTDFSLFSLFSLPVSSYNKQIERNIDERIGRTFSGQFNVTAAALGDRSRVPCIAHNSLLLTGSANLG